MQPLALCIDCSTTESVGHAVKSLLKGNTFSCNFTSQLRSVRKSYTEITLCSLSLGYTMCYKKIVYEKAVLDLSKGQKSLVLDF